MNDMSLSKTKKNKNRTIKFSRETHSGMKLGLLNESYMLVSVPDSSKKYHVEMYDVRSLKQIKEFRCSGMLKSATYTRKYFYLGT